MKTTRRHFLYSSTFLLLAAAPYSRSIAATPRVVSIRVWPAPEYTRVTIESDKALAVTRQFFIDTPPRLVVDVQGTDVNSALRELVGKVKPNDPYITGMRVGQNTPGTTRFVLDLKQEVKPQVFNLEPVAAYKHRLVFDLLPVVAIDPLEALIAERFLQTQDPAGYDVDALEELISSAMNDPLGDLIAERKDRPVPESIRVPSALPKQTTPSGDSKSGTKPPPSSQPARPPPLRSTPSHTDRIIIVALDPGHGGEDPGAIGPRGTREKDVVLRIAKILAQRINASKVNGNPMRAFLTRDGDFFVPLALRVEKARRVQADLFVSIHADAFTTPKARGGSVFALSQRGASSAAARWLATKENQADLVGGINVKSNDAHLRHALLDMSTSAQIKDSMLLGRALLGEMKKVGRLHKPHVEQAGFAVLKAPDIPSVLVETAFISNHEEEARLRTATYQRQLADALMVGIGNYFAKNPPLARSRSL